MSDTDKTSNLLTFLSSSNCTLMRILKSHSQSILSFIFFLNNVKHGLQSLFVAVTLGQ